jgi:hypothetical protein
LTDASPITTVCISDLAFVNRILMNETIVVRRGRYTPEQVERARRVPSVAGEATDPMGCSAIGVA